VIATSSTSSLDLPDFAAAREICSRTRSRFSAIDVIAESVWQPFGLPIQIKDRRANAFAIVRRVTPVRCANQCQTRQSGEKALSGSGAVADTHDMITKNIGMLLLAIYLIAVGILTLTGLGIGFITGVLALVAGIFILIGR
jgi:hypothetical protein